MEAEGKEEEEEGGGVHTISTEAARHTGPVNDHSPSFTYTATTCMDMHAYISLVVPLFSWGGGIRLGLPMEKTGPGYDVSMYVCIPVP